MLVSFPPGGMSVVSGGDGAEFLSSSWGLSSGNSDGIPVPSQLQVALTNLIQAHLGTGTQESFS